MVLQLPECRGVQATGEDNTDPGNSEFVVTVRIVIEVEDHRVVARCLRDILVDDLATGSILAGTQSRNRARNYPHVRGLHLYSCFQVS